MSIKLVDDSILIRGSFSTSQLLRPPFSHSSLRIDNMAIDTDISLYTEGTPNGLKITIALEELGLAYKVREYRLGLELLD